MLKKDKTKPFRIEAPTGPTGPEGPTNPTSPTAEDMLNNCAINKLKADRTPIPDNRFTLPPEYGVDGGGSSDAFNGHEYVDLGLPSGTLWAKMNVGANSPTDYGLYFAWGETQGYTDASTKAFTWNDYKFNPSGDGSTFTKYNATDGLKHLELEDDAAHVNMGGEWHMPNIAQCIELFANTKNGFISPSGTYKQLDWNGNMAQVGSMIPLNTDFRTAGYIFYKSDDALNNAISTGEYLFIPAGGLYSNGSDNNVSFGGDVWTSASGIWEDSATNLYFVNLIDDLTAGCDEETRSTGFSVRGVVGQMDEITDETTPDEGGK